MRITDETTSIQAKDSPCIDLGSRHEDNKGFESLFFDPLTRTLLTMRELPPYELVSVPLDAAGEPGAIHRECMNLAIEDVAALGRDAEGDLWVMSEASACLIQMAKNGHERRRTRLEAGTISFEPEGMAFGTDGNLFIVGEPATFVVLTPDHH